MTDPWARDLAEVRAALVQAERETPELLSIINRVGEIGRCQRAALPTNMLISEARGLGINMLVGLQAPAQIAQRQGPALLPQGDPGSMR